MASASGQSNPWAMRIGIFGLVCIFISAIMLFGQTDAIDNAFNPRNLSEIKVTGENSEVGELEIGCHIAVGLENKEYGDMTLRQMAGSSPSSDTIDTASCATDWQPMDSSGQEYYFVEEWDVKEKGEYVLSMECSSDLDCDNSTIWLVDVTKAQWTVFGETGLILAGGMCCFGLILLPVALILYFSNKGKSNVMMINANGQIIPVTDLTPQTIERMANKPEEVIDNPFADTGISNSEEFIDGKEGVENGTLLTTEQVFALMRGDVEEAQNRVSDPFADFNQKMEQNADEEKKDNSNIIAFWDSGDDETITTTESKQSIKDKKQNLKINKKQSDKSDWKEWDEL